MTISVYFPVYQWTANTFIATFVQGISIVAIASALYGLFRMLNARWEHNNFT